MLTKIEIEKNTFLMVVTLRSGGGGGSPHGSSFPVLWWYVSTGIPYAYL